LRLQKLYIELVWISGLQAAAAPTQETNCVVQVFVCSSSKKLEPHCAVWYFLRPDCKSF